MKHRGERRHGWGEGRLIAAALALILALCLAAHWNRLPRGTRVQPVHAVSVEKLANAERVDINAADAAELSVLPGIGAELARRIVEYRAENGPFASAEEIMKVRGIGEGKFEAIRRLIFAG